MRQAIERWFAAWGHFAYRRAWSVIGAVLAATAALATQVPSLAIDTSTEGFLREDDPIRVDYAAFRRQFGRDDMILLAIETERVFDFGVLEKLRALHREIENGVPKLQDVTSLVNARETRGEDDELVVRELMADWPRTPEELAAIEARALANPLYRDNLLSEDGRVTTIVIETDAYSSRGDAGAAGFVEDEGQTPAGSEPPPFITGEENGEIVNALSAIVERHQAPGFHIHVAGGPTMIEHLSRAVAHDMQRFTGLAILAIAALLFALFRRVAAVILPLLVVILSLVVTLALMGMMGTPISLPTQILPSFLLAVGVGDSVHVLAIFYQRVRAGDGKQQAIAGALAYSGLAIVMTSLTTAGALLSFVTAQIAPVADLGVFGPIGVMMALGFTILLLPALIAVFPMRPPRVARDARPALTQRALVRIGEFSAHHAVAICLLWAGLTGAAVFGALQVRFAHDPMSWFPEDDPYRVANEFVNDRLNGTMFLEVVVDTGEENGLHDPALLKRLDELRRFALGFQKGEVYVGKAFSPADVLKEIHQALNENRQEFYVIPDDRELVAQEFLLFESAGSDDLEKLVDSRFSQGRMTLKFPFLDAIQYGPYLDALEARFREVLGAGAQPRFTGLLVMAGRTIDAVIHSLTSSYVLSFLVITPLMILMIGSLRLGLLSMLPNLAPVIVTLGLMGWVGMPLDAFTLLIGSIALGLAVDDTIHFLNGFRVHFQQTGDRFGSVRETLATTGQAMLFTSLVLSSGFFVYMFASMRNLFNFGLLSGFTIVVACVADLTLTPALMTLFAKPRRMSGALVVLALLVTGAGAARAETLTGRQIMERVDARDDGDHALQDMEMLLIDKNGSTRSRHLRMWRRDVGVDVQSILFFLTPADVKDTGFLTYDYDDPERDDDQWLYLPALKKTKRIATGDKSGSFMGSDFSYADMTERNLEHYDYRLLKEDVLDGVKVWHVEAIPNTPKEIDETGYTKSIHVVRQDNDVMVRTISWLRRGGRVKYYEVKRLEQIDGIWVATLMQMTTRKGDATLHKTVLELKDVHFGQPMDDSRFSVRQLEKGL